MKQALRIDGFDDETGLPVRLELIVSTDGDLQAQVGVTQFSAPRGFLPDEFRAPVLDQSRSSSHLD